MNFLMFAFSLIAALTYQLYDQAIIKEIIFLPIGLSFLAWAFFEKKDWLRDPGTWFGLWLILNVYTINGEFLKWLGCLGIYFYVRKEKDISWILIIGGLAVMLYNLFILKGNYSANNFPGSFVNSNIAGGYWLLYFFFFLSLGWNKVSGSIVSLYLMYISSCQASIMGLVVGLIALVIAYRPRLGSVLLILVVAGGAFYWALPLKCIPLTDRYLFYQSALDMIRFHWLTGFGTGSFSAIFPVFADPGLYAQYGDNFYLLHAHNFIIELWAEQGIIGLGLFVWLTAWCIGKARAYRDYVLSAGVVACLAYSWTAVGLNYVPVLPLFFVMLAMIGKNETNNYTQI